MFSCTAEAANRSSAYGTALPEICPVLIAWPGMVSYAKPVNVVCVEVEDASTLICAHP